MRNRTNNLEASGKLFPKVISHFLPAENGSAGEISRITRQEGSCGRLSLFCLQFLISCFDERHFRLPLLDEMLEGGVHVVPREAPADSRQLIGGAKFPDDSVITVPVLSANRKQLGKFRCAGKDRDTRGNQLRSWITVE